MQRHQRVLLFLFLALFLSQQIALIALYAGGGGKALLGDEVAYLAWARGLAGLGPPVVDVGWWPPLQAWLLAGLLRLFGDTLLPMQMLQTVLLIAAAAFLRALWRSCDGRVHAANLAAALFLLNPSVMAYAHWLWPEPLHLFLLLAALYLLTRAREALAGIALGGALLTKSLLSLFWPACALLLLRGRRRRGALALVAAVALVIAVPLEQGWQRTGKPMIADSSAFNLVGGLSERWRSDYIDDSVARLASDYFASASTPAARNAIYSTRAEALLREQGWGPTLQAQLGRQYFRLFSTKTTLLSQLPGPACAGHTGSYRAVPPLLAQLIAAVSDTLHLVCLVGFALALAFWRRWREPLVLWTVLFFGYQLALYLLLHVKARFLLPMMPLLGAFAASALVSLSRPDPTAAVRLQGLGRGVIAAGVAALLLMFALLGPVLDRSCG
ncbi:MAG: glycosyltransferase family 39 protein [Rhodanobacteraceae bacterium]|nr:glycosyltransferase family 39 protein [Rhodanobacteraceae bacterium]